MQVYKNLDGDSDIVGYEYGNDFIRVQFEDGGVYEYTYNSAGQKNIEQAKELADAGRGLNTHIMQNMRKDYASKTR